MTVSISQQLYLDKKRMLRFIAEIGDGGSSLARSLYLPPGVTATEIGAVWGTTTGLESWAPEVIANAAASATGSVLFWDKGEGQLVIPPFPLTERDVQAGYAVDPLVKLLEQELSIALVLVRLGAYAVALCRDEVIIESKVGTGLIHGRHRKGGSSQQRFQRHREKQIEQFLIRVCRHAAEMLAPPAATPDYLVYGGAWTTILSLEKQCPQLKKLGLTNLPPLLDIARSNRKVLTSAAARVWASRVIELTDS